MSGSVASAVRVATGDWVVLARSAAVLGLGKVTDGEWDPRDDALLRVRLETASSALWLAAGDVDRLAPEDEADLVALALESQLVGEPRATELRARVTTFRRGALPFVRSPGLLDRLWAELGATDPRPVGLAAFFDRGREHVTTLRASQLLRRQEEEEEAQEAADEVRDLRLPLCPAEGLDRIIAWLPQDGLAAVCAERGRPGLHHEPRPVVKAVLLVEGLTLRPLLELLPRPLLLEVPALVGLPRLDWADPTIVAAVLGQLGPRVTAPEWEPWLPARARVRGPWDLPTTVAEASRRAVGCVRPGGLRELCEALAAPHLLQPTPEATREAIVAAGFDLAWLFESLPERVVSRLPFALGLGSLGLDVTAVEVIVPRALALVEAGLALIRVLEPILGTLPEPVRRHVARDLGAAPPADGSARSIAGVLARSHTLDELLEVLTPAERRRAGRACGVEGDEVALRELASPPEPRQHPPRVPEPGLSWLVLTGVLRSLRGGRTLERLARALGAPSGLDTEGAIRELEPPLEELVALLEEADLREAWDEVGRLALEPRAADEASAADLRAWILALVPR